MKPIPDDIKLILYAVEIIFLEHDDKFLIIALSCKFNTSVSLYRLSKCQSGLL